MTQNEVEQVLQVIRELKADPARTPDDFARSLRLSRATFYRRLKIAEGVFGFRTRYDRESGSFRIIEGHFGPVLKLSPLEAFSLIMAARHLSVSGDHTLAFDAITAVRRLAATAPVTMRQYLEHLLTDVVLEQSYACRATLLDPLREAVEQRKMVQIEYQEQMSGQVKIFMVEPCHVLFKWRALYLDGYCPEEKKYLMFRVSRIKRVKLLPLKASKDRPPYDFARRHGNSFRVFVSEKDPVEVRVKFSPRVAPMIAESFWHPSERKEPLPDGGLILSVMVSYPPEVVWWALQWGADAEVLSPPEMRQLAMETAEKVVQLYRGASEREGTDQRSNP